MAVGATGLLHDLLEKTFRELGASGPMIRTLLLRDREYVGQRFRRGGVQAVSLVGEDEIAFYDEGGVLVKTVRLEETDKKAA